ncbi:uncharacterized protein LOC116842929 isoform X2 [Odontomachus brunneus]|uniref:uncharacterized protein LOC116842929 isoform X2 n=1 Tax=Odontomachus brunneus TaxID=486640 RepID=UPI0013F19E80|nr:uncharacterized protein LOC116842929 isoform X2 [Odontomachus brunneus]XP_032668712.1 uncharacterized protein LOC116842929 isoform X2 [Odontomachus brunneus]
MFVRQRLCIFDKLYTEDHYNEFFNPNICHVCKKPNQGELIPCGSCDMVFYCSTDHQIMHQSSHMEVCAVIPFARTENLESNARPFNSDDEWRSSRKTFMQGIQVKMTRDLMPYEKEMIMCAKSCLICHQQMGLLTCRTCYSANYCDEHQWDFKEKHDFMCLNLLVHLNLNILRLNYLIISYSHNVQFSKMKEGCDNMFAFGNRYIVGESNVWNADCYITSNYVSAPLTLYYGLKEFANLFEETQIYRDEYNFNRRGRYKSYFFIVHIIGASSADVAGLPSWEIFLHFCHEFNSVKKIMELRVILVQPETDCDRNQYYKVCGGCFAANKKLYLANARVSYDDYIRTQLYKEANIIIAFQAEFNAGSAPFEIFRATQDRKCPFFFTTASQNEAEEGIMKLHEVMNVPREHRSVENKFCSYRPFRIYGTGEIYYRNTYLVVFS